MPARSSNTGPLSKSLASDPARRRPFCCLGRARNSSSTPWVGPPVATGCPFLTRHPKGGQNETTLLGFRGRALDSVGRLRRSTCTRRPERRHPYLQGYRHHHTRPLSDTKRRHGEQRRRNRVHHLSRRHQRQPGDGPGTWGVAHSYGPGPIGAATCLQSSGTGTYSFTIPASGGPLHVVGSLSYMALGLAGPSRDLRGEGRHLEPVGCIQIGCGSSGVTIPKRPDLSGSLT